MLKKMKLAFFAAALCLSIACGYDYDWMSGSFSGTSKLTSKTDEYSSTAATEIETGADSFTFTAVSFFTMGDETPLPGCKLKASYSEENGKYELEGLDRAYKGQSQDMLGCLAKIGKASTRVDIKKGWLKREKDGETTLYLAFKVRDMPDEPLLEYELKARKSSWFW